MDKNTSSILLFFVVIIAVIGVTAAVSATYPFGAFGAALNSSLPVFSCTESDGGYEPYRQGIVNGTQGGSYMSYTDACITETVLKEYYCSGSFINSNQYDCSMYRAVCIDGACVQA
jgi:hypothetical protein